MKPARLSMTAATHLNTLDSLFLRVLAQERDNEAGINKCLTCGAMARDSMQELGKLVGNSRAGVRSAAQAS